MDKLPVGQLPDLTQSNNDDEIMVITNDEYNQLKKEKIADFITDLTSTNENNALTKGTDGKMFVTDFGNASNITEGTLPVSVLPDIPKDKLPQIETADLPDSGITAGTYTYPTDIVINSKGQVTSITEGQAGANNANQDLSNLGPLGLDKINQSKALETGSVSSDADVYADVEKYAHSTFDLSKFEVVGSPTITDDGVASGFSSSDYLTFNPIQLANYNSWEIITPVFNLSSAISGNFNSVLMMVYNKFFGGIRIDITDSLKLRIFIGSSSTTDSDIMSLSNLTVSTNTNYQVKVQFTGTEYIVWYRTENGSWQEYDRVTSSTKIYNALNQFQIGQRNGATTFFNGSIDLKHFSTTADGVPVFSGNKTGTATINDIEIPYTLSKTGSKIVDAAYRDRVQDVYEQYGVAMYYTIDEVNQNFTLPMGEIYGMIERKNDELNNPFSLFDYKYTDAPIYNMSWLQANGSWYAKSVYISAYEALVVENNSETAAGTSVQLPSGTTYIKRGLSVKLSTAADITDYDFVINTTDETFRLPLKNKIIPLTGESIPVKGNGIALGMMTYDGDTPHYYGTYEFGANAQLNIQEAVYGMTVGNTNITNKNVQPSGRHAAGITDDAAKSGMIADISNMDLSDLNLYYYVGETVQNAHLIDAAQIAGNIANKANADLSNCTKPYILEMYNNDTSGYMIYSNGFCEQWGTTALITGNTNVITLLKEYTNTNYNVYLTTKAATATEYSLSGIPITANTFNIGVFTETTAVCWRTIGYIS